MQIIREISRKVKIEYNLLLKFISDLSNQKLNKINSSLELIEIGKISDEKQKIAKFLLVSEKTTNPFFSESSIEEIKITKDLRLGPLITRYCYLGRDLLRNRQIFYNTNKEYSFSTKPLDLEIIPLNEYLLKGEVIQLIKIGINYYRIDEAVLLGPVTEIPEIYSYQGTSGSDLFFKNKTGGLYSFKLFKDMELISDKLKNNSNYCVLSKRWKNHEIIQEIIPTSSLLSGRKNNEDILLENICLLFKNFTKKETHDVYRYQKSETIEEDSPSYFFILSSSRDYSHNEEVVENITKLTKGEMVELTNLIITPIKDSINYLINITSETRIV